MNELLQASVSAGYISNPTNLNISTILISILGSSLLATIISAIVNFVINKRRFDHERNLEGYRAYVDKKHEVYTEFWRLIIEAISSVNSQRGYKERPDISGMDNSDFRDLLEQTRIKIESKRKVELLKEFEEAQGNRKKIDNVQTKVNELLGEIDIKFAIPAINKANNYFLYNELYFSEQLVTKVRELVSNLKTVALTREIPSSTPEDMKKDREETPKLLSRAEEIKAEMLDAMKKELTSGDF